MNKELIKQYKAEFTHWLNGGSLCLLRENIFGTKWETVTTYNWDDDERCASSTVTAIVINDDYVEFRKALAENKTVEVFFPAQYNNGKDEWVDCKNISHFHFSGKVTDYRIKPEEPKFKVGDWVINTKPTYNFGKEPSGPFYVTQKWLDHIKEHGKTFDGNTAKTGDLENFKLWQPKEGEWCWFLNNNNKEVVLKQFLQMCPIVPTNYVSKQGTISGSVEPFIGTLPFNLKD